MILRDLIRARLPLKCAVGAVRRNSAARKMAFPFVKALHPDMYATESPEVQSVNIQCIQNFNSLWDCIDALLQDMFEAKQQKRTNVDVKIPMLGEYSLDCFHRPSVSKENEGKTQSLIKHSFKIVTPDALRSKCSVPMDRLRQEINKLFIQHGNIFIKLGLTDPWSALRERSVNISSEVEYDDDAKTEKEQREEIETMLFERQQYLHMYGGGGLFHSTPEYKPRNTKGKHHAKAIDYKERAEHKLLRERLEESVDIWMRKGNVLLHRLREDEEVEAVRNLREFVLNYSNMINFNPHHWSGLFVVIEPARSEVKAPSVAPKAKRISKYTKPAAAASPVSESDNAAGPSGPSELSTHTYSKHGFSHTKHLDTRKPVYILRIPSNFSVSRLLNYMTDNLPMANPMRDMHFIQPPPDSVFKEAEKEAGDFEGSLKNARRVF